MKNAHRRQSLLLFLLLITQLFCISSFAQGFKGIVPLKSNCEDVKAALNVKQCTFPQSVYRIEGFTVVVNFTEENPSAKDKFCYRVPAKTVSSLTVTYYKQIPLKDFEYKLKFVEELNNDISTVVYENSENGIGVFSHNGLISDVIYVPTPKDHKKYSYPCSDRNK